MIHSFFLSAKAWQLFLLFSLPIFIIIFLIYTNSEIADNFSFVLGIFQFSIIFYTMWLRSIGIKLSDKRPSNQGFDRRGFKILSSYVLIFLISTTTLLFLMSFDLEICKEIYTLIFASLLLPLFFIFSIIHIFFDAAKIIKSIELNNRVSFTDFSGEFLSLCLFPIGIWFLQANINKFYKSDLKDELIDHLIED